VENTVANGGQNLETPGHKRQRLIRLIVTSLVMVGAAYATVALVLKPMLQPDAVTAAPHKQRERAQDRGEFVQFDNIIVNPAGTMGSRYLSTTVGLQVTTEAARESIATSQPLIKDALITYLSSLTIEELTDPDTRNDIRGAIRTLVNKTVAPHNVKAVLFLDFVLQ
jgi:flagellar FliL protein